MKQQFNGWTSVFHFTFRQETKGIAFKLVTAFVALLIMGIIILVNVLDAGGDKNQPEEDNAGVFVTINQVYVLDESGLPQTDYKTLNPELGEAPYDGIEFITVKEQSLEDVIKKATSDPGRSIVIAITKTEKGFELEAVLPSDSPIDKVEADNIATMMSSAFQTNLILQSGLSEKELASVMAPVYTTYSNIGENSSEITMLIKLISPMLFSFILYFMLLLYGQNISKSVSTEKTSKLVETLLTSVHPYALITGKVLAVTSMAMIQFISWIFAGFAGLYAGNAIAKLINPDYHNSVIAVFNFLKENIGDSALSAPAVILAILFFFVGFLFYSVMAGVAGCMVSKPEDVASTQALIQFPVIISWIAVYFAPLAGYADFLNIARYIPFTAPFSVPSELLTGITGIGEGILCLAVLSVFTLLLILLSGKIYKGLILYNGEKISFKTIGKVLRARDN